MSSGDRMARKELTCSWLSDEDRLAYLVDFFVQNAPPEYISAVEIMTGRAVDEKNWSKNLRKLIFSELKGCLDSYRRHGEFRAATTRRDDKVVGLSIVRIVRRGEIPYGRIEDLLVEENSRGVGVGTTLLSWVEKALVAENVSRVFLETGIRNSRAHEFFQKRGYSVTSRVMMKIL